MKTIKGVNMSKLVMNRMMSYSNVTRDKKYVFRHQRKARHQYELRNTPVDIIAAYSPMRKINDISLKQKKKKKMITEFCISPIPPINSHSKIPACTKLIEGKGTKSITKEKCVNNSFANAYKDTLVL